MDQMSRQLDAAEARGRALLTDELARLKVMHVMQARYWVPDKDTWMRDGRTLGEIIERVDRCGVWLGGPKE